MSKQQRPITAKNCRGAKPIAQGRKERTMKQMSPTELAIKEAKQSECLKILLMAKEAKDLQDLVEKLNARISTND